MPRNGAGTYSLPAGSTATDGTTIEASQHNTPLADLVTDANTARPIVAGGTGATSESAARTALGLAIGSDVQAYSANLDTYVANPLTSSELTQLGKIDTTVMTAAQWGYIGTITPFMGTLLDDGTQSAARGTLGLGTMATQAAGSVAITGGTMSGVTRTGGTIASTAMTGSTVNSTTVGASSPSSGAFTTLAASGDVTFDTSTLKVDSSNNRVGMGTASPLFPMHVQNGDDANVAYIYSTASAYEDTILDVRSTAAPPSYLYYYAAFRQNLDPKFLFRDDGEGTCDGSWTGGGADYAEWWEWADGNPEDEDRRGVSVILDGHMMRPAEEGEQPFGVISASPAVVGDGDIGQWKQKYLRDDYGVRLVEDGEYVLNPDWDEEQEYTSREERPEWDRVGLMGKLRVRKGQPVGDRWIKMRDISDAVEEWLVR